VDRTTDSEEPVYGLLARISSGKGHETTHPGRELQGIARALAGRIRNAKGGRTPSRAEGRNAKQEQRVVSSLCNK